MEKPNFTNFSNEKGDYTIVYDLNGANETVVGYTGKRAVAENSCRALNAVLFIERDGNPANSEPANCAIFDVSHQRELLINFYEYLVCQGIIIETQPFNPSKHPDKFLKIN